MNLAINLLTYPAIVAGSTFFSGRRSLVGSSDCGLQ